MSPILEARGLTKRFGTTQALDGLDLTVNPGEVTAVLGPNGAGKTTFIRMVATLLRPDAGELSVAGIDALRHPAQVRQAISLAGQAAAVEGAMSGRENLELMGRLFGHDRRQARLSADVVIERLGLTEHADRLVRTYSGGMRRKVDLGASLVGAPQLLLLDEPTAGLDPRSRYDLWDTIRDLVAEGTSVLLTTQYLEEADQLAARNRHRRPWTGHHRRHPGRPQGRPRARRRRSPCHSRRRPPTSDRHDRIARTGDTASRRPHPSGVAVAVDCGSARLLDTVRELDRLGVEITDANFRRATLDEVFLALTGQSAADETGSAIEVSATPTESRRRRRRAA